MGNCCGTVSSDRDPSPRRMEDNDKEDEVDYGIPYVYDPDYNGPVKKRSCTDWYCLILFLAFLGGWGFIAYVGFTNGDLNKVSNFSILHCQN